MLMKKSIEKHLLERIIPFWNRMKDEENGGFYGKMNSDLIVEKESEKGVIMHSRILWFYANAYRELGDEQLKEMAGHCFGFLQDYCRDRENGGYYWSVDYKGNPLDTTKHVYCQAFSIYALSSYYDISKDESALEAALGIFELIESKCTDEFGYLEAFNVDFTPASNEKLSENGIIADKTMNTLLHIFEAYTELYRVSKKESIADRLRYILDLFEDKVFNEEKQRLEVFFDKEMNSIIDLHSYGHDIEAAWLIDLGCHVLCDVSYNKMYELTKKLTKKIYDRAFTGTYLLNENEDGVDDLRGVWWVQAEAVVGFINGYGGDNDQERYLEAAEKIWAFIQTYVLDQREAGEWLYEVNSQGVADMSKDMAGPWKGPYHNGRMCLELMKRL